jgi:hypothetical protein
LQDLRRVALGQFAALMQQAHAGEAAGLVHIGGGHQRGQALLGNQFGQNGPEVAARYRVHPGGGLIQNDQLRRVNQRAHQPQLLLHAAGQLLHRPMTKRRQAGDGQQLFLAGSRLFARHQPQPGEKVDIFLDGQIAIQVLPQALAASGRCAP